VLPVSNHADSLSESGQEPETKRTKLTLEPLEANGITAVTVGTIIWALATLVCLFQLDKLESSGRGNWIWICACGVLLGLLGIRYTRRRVARVAKASANY